MVTEVWMNEKTPFKVRESVKGNGSLRTCMLYLSLASETTEYWKTSTGQNGDTRDTGEGAYSAM
jgi:hypothetical protein